VWSCGRQQLKQPSPAATPHTAATDKHNPGGGMYIKGTCWERVRDARFVRVQAPPGELIRHLLPRFELHGIVGGELHPERMLRPSRADRLPQLPDTQPCGYIYSSWTDPMCARTLWVGPPAHLAGGLEAGRSQHLADRARDSLGAPRGRRLDAPTRGFAVRCARARRGARGERIFPGTPGALGAGSPIRKPSHGLKETSHPPLHHRTASTD
jgi:hypothetical protein